MSARDNHIKQGRDELRGSKDHMIVMNHFRFIGPCTKTHAENLVKELSKENPDSLFSIILLETPRSIYDPPDLDRLRKYIERIDRYLEKIKGDNNV